jgi:conjugal transfer pilus assembly protein TraF
MKHRHIASLILVGSLALSSNTHASQYSSALDYPSVFECDGTTAKFNWYCDEKKEQPVQKKKIVPKVEKPKPEPPKMAEASETKPTKAPELEEFKNIQKRLEELRQIAYVTPSPENVQNYIAYQNEVTQKAAVFTDTWKRVLWTNPELDYSQTHPVAKMAKSAYNKEKDAKKAQNLKDLKQEGYGLFFFYKNDCTYCHQMLYPVKLLAKRTNLDVMSIATDGVINEQFPNSVADAGQTENLGVTQTPTIMLINTKTKSIQPISTGWTALTELEKRIYVLTATKPGDNY